eukprot:230079-Rhodomonas_salina.1
MTVTHSDSQPGTPSSRPSTSPSLIPHSAPVFTSISSPFPPPQCARLRCGLRDPPRVCPLPAPRP